MLNRLGKMGMPSMMMGSSINNNSSSSSSSSSTRKSKIITRVVVDSTTKEEDIDGTTIITITIRTVIAITISIILNSNRDMANKPTTWGTTGIPSTAQVMVTQ